MSFRLAADVLVLVHLSFILFALLGGLLVAWRARLVWLHLPAVAWAAWVEASAGICPLTPWEKRLRQLAGESGYPGGFIEHYMIPLIYPAALTPTIQARLAIVVIVLNLAIYLAVFAPGLWRRGALRQ
jgi:hypothetical protein